MGGASTSNLDPYKKPPEARNHVKAHLDPVLTVFNLSNFPASHTELCSRTSGRHVTQGDRRNRRRGSSPCPNRPHVALPHSRGKSVRHPAFEGHAKSGHLEAGCRSTAVYEGVHRAGLRTVCGGQEGRESRRRPCLR